MFAGEGYPAIDPAQGGALEGLVDTLDRWTVSALRIEPARGEMTNGGGVRAFRDRIVTVRVKPLVAAGRNESQLLAKHLRSDFDARWGTGVCP